MQQSTHEPQQDSALSQGLARDLLRQSQAVQQRQQGLALGSGLFGSLMLSSKVRSYVLGALKNCKCGVCVWGWGIDHDFMAELCFGVSI